MSKKWKPLVARVRQVVDLCGRPELSDAQCRAAVVACLHYADSETGECFPSREQLAEKSCVSDRTVKRMWLKLERMGLAVRVASNGGRNRRNLYTIETRSPAPGLDNDGEETRSPAPPYPDNGDRKTRSPAPPHISSYLSSYDPLKGSALPSPRMGEASASLNGFQARERNEAEQTNSRPANPSGTEWWAKRLGNYEAELSRTKDRARRDWLKDAIARARSHLPGAAA